LFARQIAKATKPDGTVDVDALGELVMAAYEQTDSDRRRTDRSISLMIEELDSLNRRLEKLVDERTHALRDRERELKAQNFLFDTAINNMSQGLLMFDACGRLLIFNQRYLDIYGLSDGEVKSGMTPRDLYQARKRSGTFLGDADEQVRLLDAALQNGTVLNRVVDLPDGRTIAVSSEPMAGGGWVTTHQDITERRRVEKQIAHMAHHDSLTDLPNRVLFRERLTHALTRSGRGDRFAVLCLDLDHFKAVNDTLGHPVGDELLTVAAKRIRKCLREGDTVARLGGDEFAIVQNSVGAPIETAILAQRICEALTAPFEVAGQTMIVGASIGIAMAPDDGSEADELLKNADLALYRAKGDGRGTYRFFEPAMDARMKARRELELSLRHALAAGEFELHYQPITDVSTGAITCCEALLRWHHPTLGMIPPAQFIPVAEDIGLIVPIGEWVLRQACADAANWPDHVNVAVNLSAIQVMNRSLGPVVLSALGASRLPAQRLELEITESVLMQNTDATLETLHRLRELGARISLDDFGTGYSSLKYLRSFPFDKIKIDRCFIGDFADSDESVAIVRAIVALAQGLGIATTAEGVETKAQLAQIRALGCNQMQGYLFSPPRRRAEIERMFMRPQLSLVAAG
jgi:diguanylate cyclase (GGDEF)-like protein